MADLRGGGRTIFESTPKGEKQSGGHVEETGKTVRERIKTFKDQMEFKAGGKIPVECPIMQWLVRWAAMVVTRFRVGTPHAPQRPGGHEARVVVKSPHTTPCQHHPQRMEDLVMDLLTCHGGHGATDLNASFGLLAGRLQTNNPGRDLGIFSTIH